MQTSFFGETLDLSNTKPAGDFEPVPAGWYPAMLIEIETKKSEGSGSIGAKVKFKITDGSHAGKVIIDNWMTITHPTSPQAHDIGQGRLRAWCDALGIPPTLSSADPLLHKVVLVKVKVDDAREHNGRTYGASNRVETFKAYDGSAQEATQQTVVRAAAPVAQKPAPAAPAAAAVSKPAPVAPPAGGRQMPWNRATA